MAKTVNAYFGKDSQGNSIEVALSVSGAWFHRVLKWDGYRTSWTKWSLVDKKIIHPTKRLNKGEIGKSPEYIEIPVNEQINWIEWGFGLLERYTQPTGFRLPH